LSRSVPSASEAQATFAATLFDEWIRLGLRDVVISPGSRSTPLAVAAAERAELRVHVRLDERSAGFFAIGRALATTLPVAVVVTSGTAAAELHAAVAEADMASVPLLIITADRPPELHGVGAPQVIEQHELYGAMVRSFVEPGVAQAAFSSSWRPLARDLWRRARGTVGLPGPVHLNAAFVEPLLATPFELPPLTDVEEAVRPHAHASTPPAALNLRDQRVLCVVGLGVGAPVIAECASLHWAVLGDATAQGSLAHFDALLRVDAFAERVRPDVVVRLGGLPASKVLGERLREWGVHTVAFDGAGFVSDPDRLVDEAFEGLPSANDALLARRDYADVWRDASNAVEGWLEGLDASGTLSEPLVARAVVRASNTEGVPLVIGSSMPVRDVEWWGSPRRSMTYANRGVNGIDGVVSTVLGVGAGSRVLGLVGDLTMLHDVSGLVDGLGTAGGTGVLVVVDNRGGGIFSFLPQAGALERDRFELLFGTPRPRSLEAIALAFGHDATVVSTLEELRSALEKGLSREGLSVIVASVPSREENVRVHDELNAHVVTLVHAEGV
jgi:2-succinyl-5-enolpyruvyl-6-hydroxy-3-cyclohexene-1-carboxylate synthase